MRLSIQEVSSAPADAGLKMAILSIMHYLTESVRQCIVVIQAVIEPDMAETPSHNGPLHVHDAIAIKEMYRPLPTGALRPLAGDRLDHEAMATLGFEGYHARDVASGLPLYLRAQAARSSNDSSISSAL